MFKIVATIVYILNGVPASDVLTSKAEYPTMDACVAAMNDTDASHGTGVAGLKAALEAQGLQGVQVKAECKNEKDLVQPE